MEFVFGYGSLMCPDSANRTLRRDDPPEDMLAATLAGYRRLWNVVTWRALDDSDEPRPVMVLGIEPAPDVAMVGTVFALHDADELARLDERESHYDRINVTDRIAPLHPDAPAPAERGVVWTYLPRPECTHAPPHAVVAQAYADTVAKGCQLQGEEFTRRFHETTVPHDWPMFEGQPRRVAWGQTPTGR